MSLPLALLFPQMVSQYHRTHELDSSVSTIFCTTIFPDESKVYIDLNLWTSELRHFSMQRHGWLKDPVDNFIEILISQENHNPYLTDGKSISMYCGFKEPQEVILDYQSYYNVFNMRIIDCDGNDIEYLGFHYPENDHAERVANPDLTFNPSFMSILPRELLEALDPNIYDGFTFYLAIDMGNQNSRSWVLNVTEPIAAATECLHLPNFISRQVLGYRQRSIDLVDLDNDINYPCQILTLPGDGDARIIRQGWFDFIMASSPSVGNRIVFSVSDLPEFL